MSTPRDLPLMEAVAQANDQLLHSPSVEVYQKWTCSNCGSRQTMEDKNVFYTQGRCEECLEVTEIAECGYALIIGSVQ